MGYSPDWQKQSYAKNSSTPKVTQKGNIVRNELFHNAPSRLGLADGGDVTEEQLKKEGLEASRRENADRTKDMGGLEKFVDGFKQLGRRLTEGNVDSKNSEAYYKYGAGRGQIERDKVRDAKAVEDGRANAGPRDGDADQWASGRSWATSKPADVDTTTSTATPVVETKQPEVEVKADPNSSDDARSEISKPNNAPQVSKSRQVDNGSSYTNPNNSNASISSDYSSSGNSSSSNSSSNKSGADKNNKRRRTNNNNAAVKNASAAGTKYAEAFREANNMPANATAEERQRAAERVSAALEDYKAQSKKIKPKKNK